MLIGKIGTREMMPVFVRIGYQKNYSFKIIPQITRKFHNGNVLSRVKFPPGTGQFSPAAQVQFHYLHSPYHVHHHCFPSRLNQYKYFSIDQTLNGSQQIQQPQTQDIKNHSISKADYEKISEETLESLTSYFDELVEKCPGIEDTDVAYSSGVLTIKLGKYGTYVINKQTPNRQIWLSSPTTGPKRYDFLNQTWVYKHDGVSMYDLLNSEIPKILQLQNIDFNTNCAFGKNNLLLAEKNIIDFVEKNLGQEAERLSSAEFEMDTVCNHICAGILDFPKMISHDFCDITTAFDIYIEAFTRKTTSHFPLEFGHGIFPKTKLKNERFSKMPFRGDELSQRQFVNAVLASGIKIRTHILECTDECTASGRLENLYVVISNVVMIRNYLWIFQEILESDSKSKLKGEYKEFCELVEVISELMLQCQTNLLTTYILQDETSQNWDSDQAYFEGQRASPTIKMWAYFLRGMRADMWKIMPPQLAQRILGIIINDSLAILTARYSKIEPTAVTLPQFVCDIANILTTVEQLLLHISTNLFQFCGNIEPESNKTIFSIHLKCRCLIMSLVLVGAPLEVLYKSFRRGLSSCALFQKEEVQDVNNPVWSTVLSTLCPKFYKTILPQSDWEVLSTLKLLTAQPFANWSLVYLVLTLNNCKLSKIILTLFPSAKAPLSDFILEGKGFKYCGSAGCISSTCHALPKSLPNFHVASSLLHILAHTVPRVQLVDTFRPVLRTITPEEWKVMDRTNVWTTSKKPVWFTSLIDVLLPLLKTCVQSLCINIANAEAQSQASKGKEEDSTQLVIELLNILTELLSVIPRGFFLICEEMDDMIPSEYYPVRNNVSVHFLITALYILLNLGPGIINSAEALVKAQIEAEGSEKKVKLKGKDGTKTSEDQSRKFPEKVLEAKLLATSERLCHLDDTDFDQAIYRLISHIESMMKQTQTQMSKNPSIPLLREYYISNDIASLKSDLLLSDIEGQLSLRVVYWFLMTHNEVLQDLLLGNISSGSVVKFNPNLPSTSTSQSQNTESLKMIQIPPRIHTYVANKNTIHEFHYPNKERTFDEIIWNFDSLDWVSLIRYSKLGFHKALMLKQLERRSEFKAKFLSGKISGGTSEPHSSERMILVNKMVDEIRALVLA